MTRLIGGVLSLAFLAVIIAGAAIWWIAEALDRPGGHAENVVVTIPAGAGVGAIGALLRDAGAVDDAGLFEIGTRVFSRGDTLKAGEYEIAAGASTRAVIAQLVAGQVLVRRVTVAEGLTVAEVVALLEAEPGLSGAIEAVPAEGTLLPDTYHFTKGDSRADLIARMTAAMTEAVDRLWAERAEGLPIQTKDEALVLASIVEKETAVPGERPHVAGVFVNRLRDGMRLQSDPTAIYGLTGGSGPLDRALTRADLREDNPYNTYVIDGLPPTPIANPGIDSIAAVVDPLETEDLFFVADGNGGHVFARTLEEHNRNVAAWRRIQRERAKDE